MKPSLSQFLRPKYVEKPQKSKNKALFTVLNRLSLLFLAIALASCDVSMRSQAKNLPLSESDFFPDRRSARPLVAGTIPQSQITDNDPLITGKDNNGQLLATIPISVTLQVLQRGQQRFDIYCSPCHGFDGYGKGMIVQRGFSPPPSFHTDRLRQAPPGHIFDVITNGFGQMYSYSDRIDPADRWAIVAYIRALQFSQNVNPQNLPPDIQSKLNSAP